MLRSRIKEPVFSTSRLVQTFENFYYKCFSHAYNTFLRFASTHIYSYTQFPKFSAYPFIYRLI